jgi:hypothetical protein
VKALLGALLLSATTTLQLVEFDWPVAAQRTRATENVGRDGVLSLQCAMLRCLTFDASRCAEPREEGQRAAEESSLSYSSFKRMRTSKEEQMEKSRSSKETDVNLRNRELK